MHFMGMSFLYNFVFAKEMLPTTVFGKHLCCFYTLLIYKDGIKPLHDLHMNRRAYQLRWFRPH